MESHTNNVNSAKGLATAINPQQLTRVYGLEGYTKSYDIMLDTRDIKANKRIVFNKKQYRIVSVVQHREQTAINVLSEEFAQAS